ncbi:MAG: DUF5110 domain-containing protein [Anaerolineaceae bacterium]|nr:DUF5110 domain-containing protein [Anaerolineaceae bacterium]
MTSKWGFFSIQGLKQEIDMRSFIRNLTLILLPALMLAGCQETSGQATVTLAPSGQETAIPSLPNSGSPAPEPEIYQAGARVRYCQDDICLMLEFLEDGLLHGEYAPQGSGHDLSLPISTTPMVSQKTFPGPTFFTVQPDGSLATDSMLVTVDGALCFTGVDKTRDPAWEFARICPQDMEGFRKHLSINSPDITDIYGLGEQFLEPGVTDGNWMNKVRFPGVDQGNALVPFSGGMVGNAQFSIAYFLGHGNLNYALFLDNPAVQTWNFRKTPWDINVAGDVVRFYLMTGANLPQLRASYMALTGTPPVPPKKMFGLWVSEYGFDDWQELEDKLATLRANNFPVDGFVLDLLWFGGIRSDSIDSPMGGLNWDTVHFPDPAAKIAALGTEQGVGIITIEEPYISAGLPEYADLAGKGYLVRQSETGNPVYLEGNPWWGIGGMMDWTNSVGSAYWHDEKRQPLVEDGVIGHWTDLGEPEAFAAVSWYEGVPDEYGTQHSQYSVHNLYNFFWSQSIVEGYQRNGNTQRPFILSRSGAPGSQRFGVSMWSGDIGSNLDSLAAHLQVQGQMSLSGMDYFGSDIGGFYRSGAVGGIDNIYTPWLAAGALLDVPVRPHTNNLCNCQETAPDRVGDVASNLASIRLRYTLSPYLYSLAHRAYLYGEPVFPPLVYAFQQDEQVRKLGAEKMIGQQLLAATSTTLFQEYLDVYLPAGKWVNYYTDEWYSSKGEVLEKVPLMIDGVYRLPLYLLAGAILPLMYVDDQTMNITGLRKDGSRRDELIVRVVADEEPSSFTLFEDDGKTIAYQNGAVRTTTIHQQKSGSQVTVLIEAAQGTFAGALKERDNWLQLVVADSAKPAGVSLNGEPLPEAASEMELGSLKQGWVFTSTRLVLVKTGTLNVDNEKKIVINW